MFPHLRWSLEMPHGDLLLMVLIVAVSCCFSNLDAPNHAFFYIRIPNFLFDLRRLQDVWAIAIALHIINAASR